MVDKGNVVLYYWGVAPGESSGHGLLNSDGKDVRADHEGLPWLERELDAGIIQSNIAGRYKPQGFAIYIKKNGWTLISFWDRSADSRHKSNSAFIAKGNFSFDTMLKLSREAFPALWQRFKFEVVPIEKATAHRSVRDFEREIPDATSETETT